MKAKKFYGSRAAYSHRKNAKTAFFTNYLCPDICQTHIMSAAQVTCMGKIVKKRIGAIAI